MKDRFVLKKTALFYVHHKMVLDLNTKENFFVGFYKELLRFPIKDKSNYARVMMKLEHVETFGHIFYL